LVYEGKQQRQRRREENDHAAYFITDQTPLVGASAGAIAVATHACQLKSTTVIDATIALCEQCTAQYGTTTRRLIPALRQQMQQFIGPSQLECLQNRPGLTGIAYQQLFPTTQSILQTHFTSIEDLIDAVSFSSTFPFFSDTWPVAFDTRQSNIFPRVVVDGFFSVPRDRFGCPDINTLLQQRQEISNNAKNPNPQQQEEEENEEDNDTNNNNTNTVTEILVSCFPQEAVGLNAVPSEQCISPSLHSFDHGELTGMTAFIQLATEASSPSMYYRMYEQGLADGEAWCRRQMQAAAASPRLATTTTTATSGTDDDILDPFNLSTLN
jgi:hypothetical protein